MDVADQVARALEIAQKLIGGLERKPAIEHAVQAAGMPQPVSTTKPTSRELSAIPWIVHDMLKASNGDPWVPCAVSRV